MQLATVAQELPPRLVDHERMESSHARRPSSRFLGVFYAFSRDTDTNTGQLHSQP
jgi:hypothetical protein